jgi:hypothetical protein
LLEQALAAGGPFEAVLRAELDAVRLQQQSEAAPPAPVLEETRHRPSGP